MASQGVCLSDPLVKQQVRAFLAAADLTGSTGFRFDRTDKYRVGRNRPIRLVVKVNPATSVLASGCEGIMPALGRSAVMIVDCRSA